MATLNVQFADDTQKAIISYFAVPQDVTIFQNQGTVDSSDARWKSFYNSLSVLSQQSLTSIAPAE